MSCAGATVRGQTRPSQEAAAGENACLTWCYSVTKILSRFCYLLKIQRSNSQHVMAIKTHFILPDGHLDIPCGFGASSKAVSLTMCTLIVTIQLS